MYFSNTNNDRALPVNTKYEGEFSDGLTPNGYGKATYSDGTVKEGLWKDGKFIGE